MGGPEKNYGCLWRWTTFSDLPPTKQKQMDNFNASPQALGAHEEIAKLKAVISTQHSPNTIAIGTRLSLNVSAHEQQLINQATECIKPAITYFNQKCECDLQPIDITAFNYAWYFDPTKITELKP